MTVVTLEDIDGITLGTPDDGDVLTYNGGVWGSAAPTAAGGVTKLEAATGSAIQLSASTGEIEISLDDSLESLGDVEFDFTDLASGDLMVWDGTKFVVKLLNTDDIQLTSPQPWNTYSRQPVVIPK